MKEAVAYTRALFAQNANSSNAVKMTAYMKGHFPFYGIKSPERKIIVSQIKRDLKFKSIDEIVKFSQLLWKEEERELHYAALDLLIGASRKLQLKHMPIMESLVTNKSWWDTVDGLASNCFGGILFLEKKEMKKYASKWINSDNMWLQRSSIIFQLKYKDEVDEEILYNNILKKISSKEFFIQKASGWALRQYSKFNPASVKKFISDHPDLSRLTIKEGSKYL